MAGDEIYALLRLALLMAVDVGTGQKPRNKAVDTTIVTFQKTAHVIAKLSVPFLPAVTDKTADLIQPSHVPRFGNKLYSRQGRVRFYVPEDRRIFERMPLTIPGEYGCQVEAEAINMHFLNPVVETIDNKPSNYMMIGIKCITTAGVIDMTTLRIHDVVDVVGKAAIAEGRSGMITFGGVIIDHIEDHLDTGAMQCLDHVAEFVQGAKRILAGTVGRMGCEKRDRAVPPIVDQSGRGIM